MQNSVLVFVGVVVVCLPWSCTRPELSGMNDTMTLFEIFGDSIPFGRIDVGICVGWKSEWEFWTIKSDIPTCGFFEFGRIDVGILCPRTVWEEQAQLDVFETN